MTSTEWMQRNRDKYPDAISLARACCKALGQSRSGQLYDRARKIKTGEHSENGDGGPKKIVARKRRDFDQLRKKYDRSYQIPHAIEEVAARFLVDGGWLYDSEMLDEVCARVPRGRSRWSQYRDLEQYERMQVRIEDKLIWIDPEKREAAERMRAT